MSEQAMYQGGAATAGDSSEQAGGAGRDERKTVAPASYSELGPGGGAGAPRDLRMISDIPLSVTVELGRTTMKVRDLLALHEGAVVELDRAPGATVDIVVNGKVVARGDVVVVDEDFGVRITEVVDEGDAA